MSVPTSPEDRAVGPTERLHPLFLLTGIGGALRGVAGAYAVILYLLVSGQSATALVAAIAMVAIGVVGVMLYWRRFEFRVGESEIRIDSGILNRRHRSIPFDRIQDVDISQGPVARLLGLAEVKFETGGGSVGPNSDEGVLHAIALERAEQIRALVRASRRPGAVLAGTEPGTVEAPVYVLTTGRLLLAGLFNFSLAVFAGLFGLTQTFGEALGFDPLKESFWRNVLSASDPIADFVLAHRFVAVTAGALLLILLGLATGLVRTALRDWGFRLDRTDAGLRRRRGLLTRTDVTLPVRRAQAALLKSGPVRDRFGWSEVRLQSLARDETGSGDHVLAPLATHADADRILDELGWRPLGPRIEWRRVSRAYVWTLVLGLAPLLLIAGVQAAVFAYVVTAQPSGLADRAPDMSTPFIVTAGFAVLLIGAVLLRWIAWRRTAFAVDGERILIRTGWWRRRLVVLPTSKIQSIDLSESFVSRWFGVSALHFGVAGGTLRGEIIPAIPRHEARAIREELLSSAP